MLESILELSDVDTHVFPLVLALTLWFTHDICPGETVTIGEDI